MKKFTLSVATIAVTTLMVTAFTTSNLEHNNTPVNTHAANTPVAQVVIVGKRMSAWEKAEYDNQLLSQTATAEEKTGSVANRLAVK